MKSGRLIVIVIFVVFQLSIIGLQLTGPFFDEGIYITAGMRTLEGQGITDNYLTWFSGSLVWPVIAGTTFKIGGLIATRIAALFLATCSLIFISNAIKNTYDEKTSFWATLLLSINGPFLALSHLGVYDLPALAGISASWWALTNLIRSDNRMWVGVSGAMFSIAVLSKYPMIIMFLPLLLILIKIRRKKAYIDLGIIVFIFICFLLAFLFPAREKVGQWLPFILNNSRNFGTNRLSIILDLLFYSAVPLSLVILVSKFVAKAKIHFRYIFLLASLIWPLYHLALNNTVSMNKHIVFGFIFLYPLIGVFFKFLWSLNKLLVVTLVSIYFFIGIFQMTALDTSWTDERPASKFLLETVNSGQKLLMNYSWPYTMYLYSERKIASPWDIYDFYRISGNNTNSNICEFDWYIEENQPPEWPQNIKDNIRNCNSFRRVYEARTFVNNFGADGRFITYPVDTVIWKNEKK